MVQNYHDFIDAIVQIISQYLQQLKQDMEIAVTSIGDKVPATANRPLVCCQHLENVTLQSEASENIGVIFFFCPSSWISDSKFLLKSDLPSLTIWQLPLFSKPRAQNKENNG